MLREKITEKFLTLLFSIAKSEEMTSTVVSHVLRTRCIQRASCEMLLCIYKDWFWFLKGMVAGCQSVGTGITWRHKTSFFFF